MMPPKLYFLVPIVVLIYLLLPFHGGEPHSVLAEDMPGVGISLSVDNAVISLRKEDGSFEDVGRIEGDQEYVEMMWKLSSRDAKHPSPPYDTMEELWKDWPRQLRRRTRKALGLPASADVGLLSNMLKQLLDLPTDTPGLVLRELPVVISFPAMYGLSQEDIVDAASYLGVKTLYGQHIYQPRNMVAAFAGHGRGLCETYQDKEACRQEGLQMPVHETLFVEYTNNALLLNAQIMREAHDLGSHDTSVYADFSLGSQQRDGGDELPEAILLFLQRYYGTASPAPRKMLAIITGQDVGDEIVEAVKRAVQAFEFELDLLVSEPEYVTARGAAELAWRSLKLCESSEL
ncbi:unnamed protein product [Periconia digitata]|uniref:Uncharacterized protein n=1 Tax=Periconia digitata TaxID=1303443 RepID=A0A9W4UES7_9PLEO|nr:unnamed protein product [Periconia digitata]